MTDLCRPEPLTPEQTAEAFRDLGVTPGQPRQLELLVEFQMGRMGFAEYRALCVKYGYPINLEVR